MLNAHFPCVWVSVRESMQRFSISETASDPIITQPRKKGSGRPPKNSTSKTKVCVCVCVCVCVSCACVYVANQGAQGRPRSGHWGSCDVHLNSERMSCIHACPCQIDIEIIKETDTDIVCKWCTAHSCRCSLDVHGQGGLCASGVTKHSVASLCANLGCYVPTPIIFLF